MKSSFLLLPLILLFLGSCNSDNNNSKQSDTASDAVVNVYSHRHYTSDEKLYKAFEAETGIKVKLVKASADQLLERIKMEGENSPADLIITIDAGRLWRAKDAGLLQAIESAEIMDQIDPLFRDKEKQWVGLTYRSRVFVVHKDRIEGLDLLKTYDGLAHPKFKGRVLVRSSENLYNQSLLSALIAHKGEANALNWTKQVVENMARKPKGNDTDQLKSVAAGIGDIALVNTYYLARLMDSEQNEEKTIAKELKIIFPDSGKYGAHINISGIGLLHHSKNKENALKLIQFLTNVNSQELLAEENNEYPVNPDAEWPSILKAFGDFRKDTLDLNDLGKYNTQAVKIMDEAGWQ